MIKIYFAHLNKKVNIPDVPLAVFKVTKQSKAAAMETVYLRKDDFVYGKGGDFHVIYNTVASAQPELLHFQDCLPLH